MSQMKPFRIAVLSDLHIDAETEPDSWSVAKKAFKAAVKAKVDHVVIAGDMFDCATAMSNDLERVKKALSSHGLWHRDRLTVVVGNHDIFHTPHHGTLLERAGEYAYALYADAQERHDEFCEWASELSTRDDRLWPNALFPLAKQLDHVLLLAADSTADTTSESSNGYWPADDEKLLREAVAERSGRRVMAMHHPPYEDDEFSISTLSDGYFPFGFVPSAYRRLRRFVADAAIETVVCGHLHSIEEDDVWDWDIGRTGCEAHIVGRTGGMHDEEAAFGVLEVPVKGKLGWEIIEF